MISGLNPIFLYFLAKFYNEKSLETAGIYLKESNFSQGKSNNYLSNSIVKDSTPPGVVPKGLS